MLRWFKSGCVTAKGSIFILISIGNLLVIDVISSAIYIENYVPGNKGSTLDTSLSLSHWIYSFRRIIIIIHDNWYTQAHAHLGPRSIQYSIVCIKITRRRGLLVNGTSFVYRNISSIQNLCENTLEIYYRLSKLKLFEFGEKKHSRNVIDIRLREACAIYVIKNRENWWVQIEMNDKIHKSHCYSGKLSRRMVERTSRMSERSTKDLSWMWM